MHDRGRWPRCRHRHRMDDGRSPGDGRRRDPHPVLAHDAHRRRGPDRRRRHRCRTHADRHRRCPPRNRSGRHDTPARRRDPRDHVGARVRRDPGPRRRCGDGDGHTGQRLDGDGGARGGRAERAPGERDRTRRASGASWHRIADRPADGDAGPGLHRHVERRRATPHRTPTPIRREDGEQEGRYQEGDGQESDGQERRRAKKAAAKKTAAKKTAAKKTAAKKVATKQAAPARRTSGRRTT